MKSLILKVSQIGPQLLLYNLVSVCIVFCLWISNYSGFINFEYSSLQLLLIYVFLTASQFITAYCMEEFIMEFKGNQTAKWVSAPLGILFFYLSYSILSLSFTLLI